MVFLAGLIGLLLVLTAEARVGPSSESSFCGETKECLLYNLTCGSEDSLYEVRHYENVKWVSTDYESRMAERAMIMSFRRLFQYINGSNADGVTIDMTAPVLFKIKDNLWPWQSSVYTMSFLLPSAHQLAPPSPTDSTVYITEMPHMKVYVRSYGGWMMSWVSRWHARILRKNLDSTRASFDRRFHYAVGYDSPMKFFDRHNEVWYVAEGDAVCPPEIM